MFSQSGRPSKFWRSLVTRTSKKSFQNGGSRIPIDPKTGRKVFQRLGGLGKAMVLGVITSLLVIGVRGQIIKMWDWIVHPTYRIVVVATDTDEIWQDLRSGVKYFEEEEEARLKRLRIDIEIRNHEGNLPRAQEYAKQLMEDRHVLGIVLAGTTTQAEELLEHFRGSKPVLLARATNPHLTLYDNFFRLPPSDEKQVLTITQFIRDRHKHIVQEGDNITKIAILRDYANQTYAQYIADKVREKLDGLVVSGGAEGIKVVVDGEIGGRNIGVHISSDFAEKIKPNLIFYAGIQIHQGPEKSWELLETLPKVNQRISPLPRISGLHLGCRYV